MPPKDEPAWTIIQCPKCASVSKCDPALLATASCPNCSMPLNAKPEIPDPNELQKDEETPSPATQSEPAVAAGPTLGGSMISQLGAQAPADPDLDAGRIKRTTDEDLVSKAEDRIRVKRSSKRVKQELTGWDGGESDPEAETGRKERLDRRFPSWVMWLGFGAIAIVPIAFICLTAYGMFAATREKEVPPEPPSDADMARSTLSDLEAATLDRNQSKVTFERAREVAEKFLAAETWEERLPFVRQPERVASLMKAFYARPENEDRAFAHRPISTDGRVKVFKSLMLFTVESPDLEKLPLAVERIDDETYRVDWESFVGHNEVPWAEMKTARPDEPFLMRAHVRKREYYNYGFKEEKWSSWQLEDRRGNHRLFGYVERGSTLEIDMYQQTPSKNPVFVLLKVRFPENAPSGDQVEITDVVAKGWIHPGRD